MSKHTPGPWHVIGKQGTAIWCGERMIAQMSDARTEHRQARIDAILISASPDMLAALKESVTALKSASASIPQFRLAYEAVKNAILKATGADQ